jgi:DNA polymerase III epsilon subunit family exonuclease
MFQKDGLMFTMDEMVIPPNLISDSTLVKDTFDLLRVNGGSASFAHIAETVLCLSNADDELAFKLITDLVRNDSRFCVDDAVLALKEDSLECQPLNEIEFVVLDVEAVTVRSQPARIIELGAYRVRDGKIIDEFETLINPQVILPKFIVALTGISDEMLKHAPLFAEVAGPWLEFAGDAVLVAHNSDFDLKLLNQEIGRCFPGYRMRNAELCTVDLARRVMHNLEGHNLDALADHFGFEISRRHRAAGDAFATARLFMQLLNRLRAHGVRNLAQARNFQAPKEMRAELETQLAFGL